MSLVETEPQMTFSEITGNGLNPLIIEDYAYVAYPLFGKNHVNTGRNFINHIIESLKIIYRDDSEILT